MQILDSKPTQPDASQAYDNFAFSAMYPVTNISLARLRMLLTVHGEDTLLPRTANGTLKVFRDIFACMGGLSVSDLKKSGEDQELPTYVQAVCMLAEETAFFDPIIEGIIDWFQTDSSVCVGMPFSHQMRRFTSRLADSMDGILQYNFNPSLMIRGPVAPTPAAKRYFCWTMRFGEAIVTKAANYALKTVDYGRAVNKGMVYYADTLKLCHEPTQLGKEEYQKFLEAKADEILFKHEHPVKWALGKAKEAVFG